MVTQDSVQTYLGFLKQISSPLPDFHIVLGSGFGEALKALEPEWALLGELGFTQVPGLVGSTVQDHKGAYRVYRHLQSGAVVQFQMGRIHGYEGHSAKTVIQPVMLPRLAGIKNFILTNAAGGLLPHMEPGDAMIIQDHVNLTGQNPLIGQNPTDLNGTELGPRFPDMGNCYLKSWQKGLEQAIKAQGHRVTHGVYLGLLGPTFETHAEVRLYASWGMGSVGMSTVWEAIALKHSGAKLAGLSLISNLGAGLTDVVLEHENIVETCRSAAGKIILGVTQFVLQAKDLESKNA